MRPDALMLGKMKVVNANGVVKTSSQKNVIKIVAAIPAAWRITTYLVTVPNAILRMMNPINIILKESYHERTCN